METTTSAPTLDRCATCGAHLFTFEPPHRCPPLWLVWEAEAGPADAKPIYADFPHRAAEKWAAGFANRHVLITLGGRTTVCVRSAAGELTRWDVTGELEPVYTAILHFPRAAAPTLMALLLLVLGGCGARQGTAEAGFALSQAIGVLVALVYLAAALAGQFQRLWAPALRSEPPTCTARRVRRAARAAAAGRVL